MRNQVSYEKAVGIIDGQVYVVNYTFEDELHGEPFKGVTGAVLVPLSQEYVDERNSMDELVEHYREVWKSEVRSDCTELGLEQWIEESVNHYDYDLFPGHDNSYVHLIDTDEEVLKHFPDAVGFECIGGGRCFKKDMQWDVVFDQHLVDEINRLEGE